MTPLTFIYDRARVAGATADLWRRERCAGYAAEQGWDMAGRWLDTGENALSLDIRPQFDAMLRAIATAVDTTECVCLITSWARLSHDTAARKVLATRILQAGARIETISGERYYPNGRRLPAGRLGAGPVIL